MKAGKRYLVQVTRWNKQKIILHHFRSKLRGNGSAIKEDKWRRVPFIPTRTEKGYHLHFGKESERCNYLPCF